MPRPPSQADNAFGGLPRPGKALKGVLVGLLSIWLAFAVGINWAGVSPELFLLLCGNTERILSGEIWRLFTAPMMHLPSGGIGHILTAMIGIYFLGPSLEASWGSARMLRFLFFSGVIAYGVQMSLLLVLPASIAVKLAGDYWYGAVPVIEAIAIAWALSFKGQTVRLFFILPVSSTGLILFVVGFSFLYLVAGAQTPSGLLAPFGGMAAGWLLGGSTPSPLRRAYLKFKLAQIERETAQAHRTRRRRAKQSHLRVIEGGRDDAESKDDDDGPVSGRGSNGKPDSSDDRGPDGRLLN